jgi:shikimate kinase
MPARPAVFLIGPMGAGKTTVGRQLAAVLGYEFIDTDHEITARTGADIPWIFEVEGEAGFRRRESQVIDELTRRPAIVLATGGGAVMAPENRTVLRARGFVVFLSASVNHQLARTARDRNRPLLQADDPRAVLERLYAQRLPLYRETAHVEIDTDGGNVRDTVQRIVGCLDQVAAG